VLALYGVLKLIGFSVFMYLLDSDGGFRTRNPRFGGGAHAWDVLATWDGWWYQQIAAHGYSPALVHVPGATGLITLEGNSAAFFPLYPATMRLVSDFTGLGLYGSGMLVSVVASFAAALGIYAVTARFGGRRAGLAAAGLWAVWPGSGMEWSAYSESLYIALAVWACHAVMTDRWLTAGVLTFAAGLNRPTAVALIAALTVAALQTLHRRRENLAGPWIAMAIAPLGLVGYLLWVGNQMGDLAGYFKLQDGAWAHSFDYGKHTVDVFSSIAVGRLRLPVRVPPRRRHRRGRRPAGRTPDPSPDPAAPTGRPDSSTQCSPSPWSWAANRYSATSPAICSRASPSSSPWPSNCAPSACPRCACCSASRPSRRGRTPGMCCSRWGSRRRALSSALFRRPRLARSGWARKSEQGDGLWASGLPRVTLLGP
jgi:hypothetical protein